AKIMKEVFGANLYVVPIASVENKLPSPNELKHKILIKGKALPPQAKADDYESDEEDDDEDEEGGEADPKAEEAKKVKAEQGAKKGGKVKVHQELSDLVNCVKSGHFKGFAEAKGKPNEIFSFVETKSAKFAHKNAEEYSASPLSRALRCELTSSPLVQSNSTP